MTTDTPTQGIAARARAARRAEQERQAAQHEREMREAGERLLARLNQHLAYLGISKEDIEREADERGHGPTLHYPSSRPTGRPDYADVTIDGMVFAYGQVFGLRDTFIVSLPCDSGAGHPTPHTSHAFTGVIQDYLRQLGGWVETVYDNDKVETELCADCQRAMHGDA